MKLYRHAVATYMGGDYRAAAEKFDALRERTTDKRFALMALHGAACSRLMLANSPQEYHEGLILWEKWVNQVPDICEYEHSVLFNPLIKEKMIFSNLPLTTDASVELQSGTDVPRWLLIKSKEEVDRLREELSNAQEILEKRQRAIQAQAMEIDALQGQLKALETIDQKIQEKKNAIPSTDSPTNGELK